MKFFAAPLLAAARKEQDEPPYNLANPARKRDSQPMATATFSDGEALSSGWSSVAAKTLGVLVAGVAGIALSRFRVCHADQIIVKTGAGIKNVWSGRKTIVWPFVQQAEVVSLAPTTYSFVLTAMSKEFLQADLPIDVVTRPSDPETSNEGWRLYCQNLASADEDEIQHRNVVYSVLLSSSDAGKLAFMPLADSWTCCCSSCTGPEPLTLSAIYHMHCTSINI